MLQAARVFFDLDVRQRLQRFARPMSSKRPAVHISPKLIWLHPLSLLTGQKSISESQKFDTIFPIFQFLYPDASIKSTTYADFQAGSKKRV
jgi:hypothetical protein